MKGTVIKSTGNLYTVLDEKGNYSQCRMRGKMRLDAVKSTNPIAVGDRVFYEMEEGKNTGIVSKVEERKNYIIRKATNLSKQTHIIAANIDQAFIIATLVLPKTSTGFIDRFLVTAEAYHIPSTIIFNKRDLYENDLKEELNQLISLYEKVGYKCLVISAMDTADLDMLREAMINKTTLFSGHSGVGKSTLINNLQPGLN